MDIKADITNLKCTGRHLQAIMKDVRKHLKIECKKANDFDILKAFCVCCARWSLWLQYTTLRARIFDWQNFGPRNIKTLNILFKFIEYIEWVRAEGSIESIVDSVCDDGQKIARAICDQMKIQDSEDRIVHLTVLAESKETLAKLRETWTIEKENFPRFDAPIFEVACSGEPNYGDGEDLTKKSIARLAEITGLRLLRMYEELVNKKMGPSVNMAMYQEQSQMHFDYTCKVVKTVYDDELQKGQNYGSDELERQIG